MRRRKAIPLGLFLGALVAGYGCGGAAPAESVPRTLAGQSQRGAFVPPFAYEAYIRGELALSRGHPKEAVAQLELATAAPTEDAYLLSRLAYAQTVAGQREAAVRTLAHAERIDPCAEALWLTRARIAEEAGSVEAACDAYGRAAACAPTSPYPPLASARLLERSGRHTRALAVLERFASENPESRLASEAAFVFALEGDDAALVAYSLDSWLARNPPSPHTLERGVEWALEHDRPELALRLYEHDRVQRRPELEARIQRARGDREAVRAVLSRNQAEELGGRERTAELALWAGAYERAELEASSLIMARPSDEAYALRARARMALGDKSRACEDLDAISDPSSRAEVAFDLLERTGAPALASELRGARRRARDDRASHSPPHAEAVRAHSDLSSAQ